MRFFIPVILTSVFGFFVMWPHTLRAEDTQELLQKAQKLESRGKLKAALKVLDKAVADDPKSVTAYSQRGGVHFKLGHIKESQGY